MGKRGQISGHYEWESPEKLEQLRQWASQGLTKAELAHNMGISRDTFVNWRKLSPVISDAIKKGEEDSIDLVENALFSAACSGNITAQIFFLKNKRPQDWKDKRENEISGGSGKVSFEWGAKEKPSNIKEENNGGDNE